MEECECGDWLQMEEHFWDCKLYRYQRATVMDVDVDVEVNLQPTVSRPVCLGVRCPSGTRDQFFFLLQTVAGLLFCSALSDERTSL
jgi:hypothetical protein